MPAPTSWNIIEAGPNRLLGLRGLCGASRQLAVGHGDRILFWEIWEESRSSHVQLDMSVKSVNKCNEKNNYDVLSVVNQSSRRQK